MIADVIRLVIQRVLRDKILLGLVVIGLVAVFLNGTGKEPSLDNQPTEATGPVQAQEKDGSMGQENQAAQKQETAQPQAERLEPGVAADFVKWWIGGSMDYERTTAVKNHKEAFKWMSPEAQETFSASYWTQDMAHKIESGSLVAAFHTAEVQPQAINPDGTVVVYVHGTLVMQESGTPLTRTVMTDFLIKKEPEGLRIAGLYNHQPQEHSTAYYY